MLRSLRVGVVILLLATAGQTMAGNPGQEDLDKATDAKIDAKTLKDLDEVVRLCESAKKKGLDAENVKFADQILASTLAQRGSFKTRAFFANQTATQLRKQAQEDLEKAVALNPQQPEAQLHLSRLYLLEGNKKRALECLDQAIHLGSNSADIRSKALVMRSGLAENPAKRRADLDEAVRIAPSDPSVLLAHGLLLADLGEFDKAMADLDKSIQFEPDRPLAHEAKAVLLVRLKKYDQAMVCLDKARELEPDSTAPLMQEARIHTLQANYNAAFHDLEQALHVNPDDAGVLLLRASIYQDIGQREKALADIDRTLKAKPRLAIAWRMRTMLLATQGKLDQGIEELEKFRQSNPKDLPTLLQLAIFYSAQKRHDKAIAMYGTLLHENPNNEVALRSRADESLSIGDHAGAVADYERSLTINAKDPGVLNNLAWVLATSPVDTLRNGKRAIHLATEAATITDYKQAYILSTLAAAYAESGDFKTAMQWSEKAVELGPAEQTEGLKKELASYKNKKPWRELLTGKAAAGKSAKISTNAPGHHREVEVRIEAPRKPQNGGQKAAGQAETTDHGSALGVPPTKPADVKPQTP
jgi:tetratricopeptide (TPR) repeat protein